MSLSAFSKRIVIIAGLSPFAPELAASGLRLMLETIEGYTGRGESFSFETTLSGLTYAHGIENFERYKLLVDGWQLYDNSDTPAVLIEGEQSK